MAEAGFIHTPEDSEDLAKCLYCHLVLDGWEEEDDPT
jgi:hypothetical protein